MMKNLRILLIEDSNTSIMITTSHVKSFDSKCKIIVAKSLKKGISVLEKEEFDVVLLDLTLPDSSGLETLQTLHNKFPEIPIVILSSSNDEKLVLKALEFGAQDYIFKEELTKSALRKSILYSLERYKFTKAINEKNKIIKENERMLKEVFENYPDGIFLLDKTKRVVLTNSFGLKFFEKKEKEILGSEFEFPIDLNISSEIEIELKDGEKRIAQLLTKKIRFNANEYYIVSLRDITENKKLQEELEFYATKDSLTGFYNRRYGLVLIEQNLKVSKRNEEPVTLCFIDIDNLKYTNDTYGHSHGDELIKTVAEGIKTIVRDSDVIVRLGGDEFLIEFLNANIQIAKSIVSRIEYKIYTIKNEKKLPFEVSISKGFSQYNPDDDIDVDKLISIADSEMYANKITKKKKK